MGAVVGRQVVGFGGIFDEALTVFPGGRTTSVPGSAEGWVARPARKLPPSFRTGDPSYFVAASTSGRVSPTARTGSNGSIGLDLIGCMVPGMRIDGVTG